MSNVVYPTDVRSAVTEPTQTTARNFSWQGIVSGVAIGAIGLAGCVYKEKCPPLISRQLTYSISGAISLLSLVSLYLLRGIDAFLNQTGDRALHLAVKDNDEKRAGWLLFFGANPNAQRCNGFTPLHVASDNDSDETVELRLMHELIGYGSNVNAPASDKETPLHRAVLMKSLEKVKLLRNYGSKNDVENIVKKTPLGMATQAAEDLRTSDPDRKLIEQIIDAL